MTLRFTAVLSGQVGVTIAAPAGARGRRCIPSEAVLDYNENWSDEDLQDFTRSTWLRAPADAEAEHAETR